MKKFFIILIMVYLIFEFVVTFAEWIASRNRKEYAIHFIEVIIQASLIFGFIYIFE